MPRQNYSNQISLDQYRDNSKDQHSRNGAEPREIDRESVAY